MQNQKTPTDMKKSFILLVLLGLAMGSLCSQTVLKKTQQAATASDGFARIEAMLEKQHYSDAFAAADSLRNAALHMAEARGTDAELSHRLLAATWYMERAAMRYQEDAMDSSLSRFRAVMPYLVPVDRAVCHLFLGNVDSALVDTLSLRGVPNSSLAPFCEQPKEALFNITPTVYDLLMHLAVQNVPLERGLELQRQLVEYSRSRGDMNLTLYNELRWLELMEGKPNLSKPYRRRLVQDRLNRYRSSGNEQVALLYLKLARMAEADDDFVAAVAYCDSAISRWPKSQGGVECANLKKGIKEPVISVDMQEVCAAGRDLLVRVTSRNTAELHYRVIAFPAGYDPYKLSDEQARARLLACSVKERWQQKLTDGSAEQRPVKMGDYQYHHHYGYVPALAPGHYMLLVSPSADFKSKGFVANGFTVAGAAIVLTQCDSTGVSGYVVDNVSGQPVRNQRVDLRRSLTYPVKFTTLGTVKTDADGFFAFKQRLVSREVTKKGYWQYYDYQLTMRHRGLDITRELLPVGGDDASAQRSDYQLLVDRPVYRPGDTVQFLLLAASVNGGREGHTVAGQRIRMELRDVNHKVVDSLSGTTDGFGRVSGRFVIAPKALPGSFSLQAFGPMEKSVSRAGTTMSRRGEQMVALRYLNVEAYKQPKFTVTLKARDRRDSAGQSLAPRMGDSLVVEGMAASYTQVPVAGARVRWSVTRTMVRPWWRRWYGNIPFDGSANVASDSLSTDAEGLFRIAFVALPDSAVELSTRPCFQYQVQVDVTDLNGETHSQRLTLKAGYENSYVHITLPQQTSDLKELTYQYCDLNGTPMKGYVNVEVEQLRLPERLWLEHPQLRSGVLHTMGETEFRKRFPLTPYSYDETQMAHWEVEKRVLLARVESHDQLVNSMKMPMLGAGVYRIILTPDSGPKELRPMADTAVVVYTPKGCQRVYTQQLLWSEVSSESARVGETVRLRVGTRHEGVRVMYRLTHGNRVIDRRVLTLNDEIETIDVPVSDTLLGGFEIELCALKEGRSSTVRHRVEVPYGHKKLDVEFLTFRDRLTPGQRERWTLRVKKAQEADSSAALPGTQGKQSTMDAALLLGMYDAALNSYGYVDYSWWPWRNAQSQSLMGVNYAFDWRYQSSRQLIVPQGEWLFYKGKTPAGWNFTALDHRGRRWRRAGIAEPYLEEIVASVGGVGYATARGEDGMVTMSAKRAKSSNAVPAPEVSAELEVVENYAVEEELVELDEADNGTGVSAEKPYLRTNQSTLAFFEPTLRTAPDGTLEYSFTAPDLLTEWDVKGLAWTRDLSVGNVERKLITRKQLMVQPNMPRFLREGDSATLMAKVMNLTDSTLTTEVHFSFTFPTTDGKGREQEAVRRVTVGAHGSEQVLFPVVVTAGGTVATYKFVATAGQHSDGEQGPLPLLTNRQAVTRSVSMYMNGAGSKQYAMELPASTTARPVSFTVEYTSNPVWMAIQTLPYMSQCSNPSNIYLFNSYYVNSLGKTIANLFPELKHCADGATEQASPLMRNADVRQTLLEETPWLGDGESEVERLRNIARYFDEEELARQCSEAFEKLQREQHADGGWPWMPGGRWSSPYVTQYILKGYGMLERQLPRGNTRMQSRALDFVDKAALQNYLEWKRFLDKHPGSTCKPIMLDYLYTRSYYLGKSFSAGTKKAYDFFYANAKERYGEYTSLYDQALLALVFQRNGDTRLAREMVERIRQKALRSDEMGMYWRDNKSGYYYYQRPVETQALLIETFREVVPQDTLSVAQMQQWLLKQKQTTRWSSDIATLRAIQALMPIGVTEKSGFGRLAGSDRIVVRGKAMTDTLVAPQQDAGYLRHTYRADTLEQMVGTRNLSATITRANKGIAWGALYYQYTEQMDKIEASETGVTLQRQLFKVEADGSLTELKKGRGLAVGDRLRVRLHVSCDRVLEYVELKELRAASLEPVTTSSGWAWTSGLNYYVAVMNSHNAVYIDRLEKGKYFIDAEYYVTNPGTFTLPPSVLQCLYAPEFRATTPGQRIEVR